MLSPARAEAPPIGRLIKLMALLWLAGVAMRMTLLVMPPVIPAIHAELHLTETQIGLLIGMPLALFALAAVPGSLLIARIGTKRAVVLGMTVAAFAGAARGAAIDAWTLYIAAAVTGLGIAVMQPGLPTLVRQWLPSRIALGTLAYTNGMVIGAALAPVFTIPFVLPLASGSWRLDLVYWAVPGLLIVPVFLLLSPRAANGTDGNGRGATATRVIDDARGGRWWPDWKNPLVWVLGVAFGCNTSPYFATNAFVGDYLATIGRGDLLGPALISLNGAQIGGLLVLIVLAGRLARRAWPFLLFGPILFAAILALIFVPTTAGVIVGTALVGIATAVTMTAILALPAFLSAPGDVPRTAAGMFTISYACAILIPTFCGLLWDLTGLPWMAFVPLCVCAVTLTILGTVAARFRPAVAAR